MGKLPAIVFLLIIVSCSSKEVVNNDTITVSIPPFRYFAEVIAGNDYNINVMVPAGSDPHVYEPSPGQISALRKSAAFISDGYLSFEITWLDRFIEMNKTMKILTLGENMALIAADDHHNSGDEAGADPHFWISPKSAATIASSIKSLFCELNPQRAGIYEANYLKLLDTINFLDGQANELLAGFENNTFMIFHPTLGYLARDYGLVQIPLEVEGKEPTPSGMKDFIDLVRQKNIKAIFVMQEFDRKNAVTIASETGVSIVTINPLSENWPGSVGEIIKALHSSLIESNK